jgi:hypothetical protein
MSLFEQKSNVAVILATFAFTMLGFLAAVITILFSFSGSSAFKKYKRKGHLDIFFFIYYFAIISLIATFALSIVSLSGINGIWAMRLALMSTVNNMVQICLLTLTIVNLSKKAMDEP